MPWASVQRVIVVFPGHLACTFAYNDVNTAIVFVGNLSLPYTEQKKPFKIL